MGGTQWRIGLVLTFRHLPRLFPSQERRGQSNCARTSMADFQRPHVSKNPRSLPDWVLDL